MRKSRHYYIRKIHRWLGVIIGIQFLLWTLGGLYFSWTNLDEIHGDHFLGQYAEPSVSAAALEAIDSNLVVTSIGIREIGPQTYYWINDSLLINTATSEPKEGITSDEAIQIARSRVLPEFQVSSVEMLTDISGHHEYRGGPLPVYAVSFEGTSNLVAYVSAKDGGFQKVRHASWRYFDFLWMLHTMDFESRDNINNQLLRFFSVMGIVTVLSGFALFFISGSKKKNKNFN